MAFERPRLGAYSIAKHARLQLSLAMPSMGGGVAGLFCSAHGATCDFSPLRRQFAT